MTPVPIDAPLRLALGEVVPGDPGRPLPHRYEVAVSAGHYLRVVARQLGVDALLRLVPPAGAPVLEFDSPTGDRDDETAHAVADADGVWAVEIEIEEWPEGGAYEVLVADLRPATDEDRLRTEAEAAIARAEMLRRDEQSGQREAYADALAVSDRLGVPDRLAYVLYRLANAESAAGRPAEAIPLYERSLALSREIGDEEAQGKLHNRIAVLERRAGRLEGALDRQRQALAFFRRLEDDELLAKGLALYGQTLDWAGRPREALAALHEALDLARRLSLREDEVKAQAWLGDVHLALEQLDRAADAYEQAAALAREIGYRRGEVLAERGLAARWTRAGEAARALPHLRRALALARESGSEQMQTAVLGDLGSAELQLGDSRAAVAALEESLSIARRGDHLRSQAFALHKLGRCRQREGDQRESARLHAEAAELFARIGDRHSEAGARYGQALALGRLGELEPALAALGAALTAADEVRRATGGHELQTSFASSKQHYRELHVDLLMELDTRQPGGGHDLAALSADDRGRSRALVDLLDQAAADAAAVSPQLAAEQNDLELRLASLRRFGQRMIEAGEGEGTAEVERRQRELLTRLDRVRSELRPAAASDFALDPRPWTAERLDALLDRETLLLVYSLGEERSYLWAVWKGGRQRVDLPPRAEIEPEALRVAAAFARLGETARDSGERAAAALARRVLVPVAGRLLRHRRVVVVADGALLHVPFAALPDPAAPGVPLVGTHELVSVPSLTVLERLRQRTVLADWKGAAAVVADPVFDAGDSRVAGGSSAPQPAPPAVAGGVLVTRALDDLGLRRFARLPGTRAEAQALLDALPKGSAVYSAFGFAASREAVLGGALAGYRVVHLATHGVLDRRTPSLSGLVFSLVDEAGRPRDGYLPLHEIYGLRLDAELVVLSACHSGTGREMNGEGLVGMTRGFLEAGVPRLVVSLWQVGDEGSAELMRRFYRAWLQGDEAPAAALAEAQRSMTRDPEWSSPYHWAGFQLVGDWTALAALRERGPDDPFEERDAGTETESDQDDDLPTPILEEPPGR